MILCVLGACVLAGCKYEEIKYFELSQGTYASTPVVVTDIRVNGELAAFVPLLAYSHADEETPRGNTGYPTDTVGGMPEEVSVEASWVELLTGRAYAASVQFSRESLDLRPQGSGYFSTVITPIYGPNGLFILASDPVPESAENIPLNDIVQICATRTPEQDEDWRSKADTLAQGREVMGFDLPPVKDPICPEPER